MSPPHSSQRSRGAGIGFSGTYTVDGKEDHPVNYVSSLLAEQYCRAGGKRLCTESEWEKAARGGCEMHGDGG